MAEAGTQTGEGDAPGGAPPADQGQGSVDTGAPAAGGSDATPRDAQGRFAPKAPANGADAAPPDGDDGGDAAAAEQKRVAEWLADLDEDTVKWGQKFASKHDQIKSHRELERRLGRSVVLPGKDATDEEIQAFRKRALGVPDTPDGYQISLPHDLPDELQIDEAAMERIRAFKTKMHEAGAPPAAVQGAIDAYFGMLKESHEAQQAAIEKGHNDAVEELQREWRDDFEANVIYARRGINEFDHDDSFKAFLENTIVDGRKLGDHPQFLRWAATMGRRMSEDTVHLAPTQDEASQINQQIDKVRQQKSDALLKGNRQRAQELDEQERQLYARLAGNAPVVGSAGRTL